MSPAWMRPATQLAIALVLGQIATARAEDLPPELVARPATLPHGLIALTLAGGYDSAHGSRTAQHPRRDRRAP